MDKAQKNIQVQKMVAAISILLFVFKSIAWWITGSVAILTDALESIVNVVAGFIGLYSLYVSAKPKDRDHPYGHGKIEFISAAIEGTLITVAGFIIIYKAAMNLLHDNPIRKLDYGILLVAATALVNFIAGSLCLKTGRRNNSLALVASGKHLLSDTWSTIGIVVGLALILITGIYWIDSIVAILFACFIIFTGTKIIRSSVAGIMDETDDKLLKEVVAKLNENRRPNWTDLHNLRIIKYGAILHLDCHMTVPWYLNVNQAHEEVDALSGLVKNEYGEAVELFVHSDGCMEFSCPICTKDDCPVRQHVFVKKIEWNIENISSNNKHHL